MSPKQWEAREVRAARGGRGIGKDLVEPKTEDGRFDMEAWKESRQGETRTWWGREDLGIDRYTAALARVRYAYENYDNVVVEFSGGKDSTAVLNVTLEVAREYGRLPLRVDFCDEEAIATETADYVRRTALLPDIDLHWYCIPVSHRNACSKESPWFYPWAPEERELWVRELPPEAITVDTLDDYEDPGPHHLIDAATERSRPTWPEFSGWLHGQMPGRTASLLGIRANESMVRRRAVANNRTENYVIPGGRDKRVDKIYPVYDWDTGDVWTAPKVHGWDHNRAYDLMEMAGISPHQQRCAPPFGEEPSQSLWQWSVCFPDIWAKLCDRVPGASTAARYARTELYAYGDVPEKPADTPWPQFIRETIMSHGDETTRRQAAQSVQFYIDRHYHYTSDPILEPKHPRTAINWEFLLMIAHRVDTKRRQSMHMTYPKTQAEADEYYEALAAHRQALA